MDEQPRKTVLQRLRDDVEGATEPVVVDVSERYRRTFQAKMSRDVLGQMLMDLGVLAKLDGSPESVARHNFGIELLAKMGALKTDEQGHITGDCMKNIVAALLRIAGTK